MNSTFGPFPYIFALLLAGGSLATYLVGALVSRFALERDGRTSRSFNLAIPATKNPEALFAVSLAAAQTTLSTVFVVFLTDAGTLGLHLLYCPLAIAVGNWLMLYVYRQMDERGHLNRSSLSGLIPYFANRVTGTSAVSYALLVFIVVPLVALLALELHYGYIYLSYLGHLGHPPAFDPNVFDTRSVGLFTVFMVLLLGYVFVGGFRAVVTSDVWQYRIMSVTLTFVFLSVLGLVITRQNLNWSNLPNPPWRAVVPFYVSVTMINLFQPLCFATSWQRFRAFRDHSTDFTVAIRRATGRVAYLWVMLIFIAVGLQLASPGPVGEQLPHFLDRLIGLNSTWFALFVFPLITMAGFSGMYSSSDTCVSALLYLTESVRAWRGSAQAPDDVPLRRHYYWVMLGLFGLTFAVYEFFEYKQQDPTQIALVLFGNAVVLAPTIILLSRCDAPAEEAQARLRSVHILASLGLGGAMYWSMVYLGRADWETQLSGLAGSLIPICVLLFRERRFSGKRALAAAE
jgi:hypothetical protein